MTPTSSVKPWLPVLFFSIVILLFLPTFFSTTYSRPKSPAVVKRRWDAFYLAFVLFAVICGFLGRRSSENDSGNPSMGSNSFTLADRYNAGQTVAEANQNTGVHRIRSSGSNPDLNHNAAALWGGSISTVDEWRYYDVSQLYRPRLESEIPESRSFWSSETKMVPADNPVSLPNPSLGFRSTPMPWMRSTDEISDDPVGKDVIFGLENPREPSLPEAPQMQPHYQRRTLEKLPATEVERSTKFTTEMPRQLQVEPAPAVTRRCTRNLEQLPDTKTEQDSDNMPEMPFLPPQEPAPETFQAMLCHRRRRSSEKIGDKEMEADFTPQRPRLSTLETETLQHPRTRNLEKHLPEMPRVPPLEPVQATMRHRRRSLDELPDAKAEQDDNFACEMRHPSQPAQAPIPAMSSWHRSRGREDIRRQLAEEGDILEKEEPNELPLPPPPPPQEDEEKQRSSAGGEKDIAVLTADKMKKKKKGSKTKLQQDEAAFNFSSTSSHPEPSSPPPLTSVIHQLFSKRGGSKRRSAQAPATATPPPQPPPQPLVQRREKQPESAPSLPPPLHSKRQALEPPPTLPPSPAPLVQHYRKKKASDVSRVLQHSPSPPRAPRPPTPPPPMQGSDPPHQVISEERVIAASNSSSGETTAGMSAVFCSSPDVNNKFDQFIAQFHANLQMERINSMREKQRRPRKRH